MPRHSREDDHTRSSPYDSSRDRRSHHHKHKSHGSDDKGSKRTDWNRDVEKDRYHKQDGQRSARHYGGRSNTDDHGDRRNREPSRYYKHGGDGQKQHRHRSPGQSDDKSHSKRTSGFDVAPSAAATATALSNHSGKFALCFPWV